MAIYALEGYDEENGCEVISAIIRIGGQCCAPFSPSPPRGDCRINSRSFSRILAVSSWTRNSRISLSLLCIVPKFQAYYKHGINQKNIQTIGFLQEAHV